MFSVSCLCVMATGLLCSSMLSVVSFLYFCMFVNIYANREKDFYNLMRTDFLCASFPFQCKFFVLRIADNYPSFQQRLVVVGAEDSLSEKLVVFCHCYLGNAPDPEI